ncbi:MAG TPA: DUF3341 domain-containing protein [Myxococcota bacterium]|jgi:hypothetical protein|nr:DUF3341 domain-containing protein [Myxococcota bacterium]
MSGWIAAFSSADGALAAARQLRDARAGRIELFAPYPVEGVEEALGDTRPRWLPRLVLAGGVLGLVLGYGVQWYTTVVSYPLDVGGRPLHSAPAFVPISFESVVLGAALAAFVGFFASARLPRLWQPVFEVPGFESATRDRFWLAVVPTSSDPAADLGATLVDLGAERVEPLEGAP